MLSLFEKLQSTLPGVASFDFLSKISFSYKEKIVKVFRNTCSSALQSCGPSAYQVQFHVVLILKASRITFTFFNSLPIVLGEKQKSNMLLALSK